MLGWLIYRTEEVKVTFNPVTHALTTTEPFPAGFTISRGIYLSTDGKPIEVATVTQKELRAIPAFFRRIWMRVAGREGT